MKKKSGITVASRKSKGRKYQQYCRDKLIELLKPYGVVPEDIKSTAMGQSGVDIQLSPFAKQFLPIASECKSHKSMAVYKLYAQAEEYKEQGEPVLFIKANHKKPLVVIDLEYYLKLEEARIKKEREE